ncbi:maltokinase N-terminal cap-like domain-containing protein [Streptomyces sp. NRRL F-5126]|uniref:maltokinase N-terminal cap-like domain-containing protein n=1 Tax=Streptomyces sp. NRRL F-5126 TaxID=1463857 RepID=UPI0004C6CD30|nr:hypothetical protein [Streptomyces sp. NRRL F-5126]
MAVIHHDTTLTPTKLELLTAWLPGRPWFLAGADAPELAKAGGFRLDDPAGEVGIEFMTVTDVSGPLPVAYLIPVTYRSAPLDGAGHALVGTTEHGVLGHRYVYDGVHDPVLVEQLYALLRGEAEPQAQSASHTADPTVTSHRVRTALPVAVPGAAPAAVADGPGGSDVRVPTGDGTLTLRVHRVLEPEQDTADGGLPGGVLGRVTAGWRAPDGAAFRGRYASLLDARPQARPGA